MWLTQVHTDWYTSLSAILCFPNCLYTSKGLWVDIYDHLTARVDPPYRDFIWMKVASYFHTQSHRLHLVLMLNCWCSLWYFITDCALWLCSHYSRLPSRREPVKNESSVSVQPGAIPMWLSYHMLSCHHNVWTAFTKSMRSSPRLGFIGICYTPLSPCPSCYILASHSSMKDLENLPRTINLKLFSERPLNTCVHKRALFLLWMGHC